MFDWTNARHAWFPRTRKCTNEQAAIPAAAASILADRVAGDTIVSVALVVAIMCVSSLGFEDEDGEDWQIVVR